MDIIFVGKYECLNGGILFYPPYFNQFEERNKPIQWFKATYIVGQKQLNLVVLSIDFRCPTFDMVLTLISCVFFFQLHDSLYEMKMLSTSQEGVLAKEF